MTSLITYLQILKCYDIIPLLRHCSVEGDTVLVLDSDYDKALDNHCIEDTDTIIHLCFNNAPFFKFKDNPDPTIHTGWDHSQSFIWCDVKKKYISNKANE